MSITENEADWRVLYSPRPGDPFFDTPEWRRLRRELFFKDGFRCLRCDKRFKTRDLSAHHLIPRDEGGADELSNLATMCNPCHDLAEVQGLRTRAAIMGSFTEKENIPERYKATKLKAPVKDEDDFPRPSWHKYVYGGMKRPGSN